jgi:hypothetical protein
MMNQGDDQKGRMGYPEQPQRPGYPMQRKSTNINRYPEKNGNYSPSTSFKYNPQSSYSMQGQQRKRMGSYDNGNGNGGIEKIARQNDIIIRLLKEIRDHLVYGVNRAERPASDLPANDISPDIEEKAAAAASEQGLENEPVTEKNEPEADAQERQQEQPEV